MMMKRMFAVLAVAAALAGCSSVKLDDVPVEDKSGTAVAPPGAGGAGGGQSSVAPVVTDTAAGSLAGPANVSRIIYFDYDSNAIKPEYQAAIEAHARFLKAANGRRVSIEGHTDERGGREYNLALGQRRAEAVAKSMMLLGATDGQIEAVSYGKERPANDGHDESAWAKNRRAELKDR